MAEAGGFEPPVTCATLVFKTENTPGAGGRERRAKVGYPLWDRDQWLSAMKECGGDQTCQIAAFRKADQSGWKSVWPGPRTKAGDLPRTTQDRTTRNLAEMRDRLRGEGGWE